MITKEHQIKVLKDILKECELKRHEKIADPVRHEKMKHRKRVIESLIEKVQNQQK